MPSTFIEDLISGGPRLRAAFPGLVRRLAWVDVSSICIECEGVHDGAFFDFMLPTRRRVRFDEIHEIALHGGVVEDRVSIDFRSIIRQLVAR